MNRTLLFEYIVFDSTPLDPATTAYFFFQDNQEQDESVTAMNESVVLQWLMNNSVFKEMLLNKFFPAPQRILQYHGLKEPFTDHHRKPGDIDLLLVDPLFPEEAVAFECKRVKAISESKQISKVNNAGAIVKGVKQANGMRELSFNRNYLVIIIVEDGRHVNMPNKIFNYSRAPALESVYDIPWNEDLHEDVGIIYIKVNQISGKKIDFSGGLGFCIDKRANPIEQRGSLTTKIKTLQM